MADLKSNFVVEDAWHRSGNRKCQRPTLWCGLERGPAADGAQ